MSAARQLVPCEPPTNATLANGIQANPALARLMLEYWIARMNKTLAETPNDRQALSLIRNRIDELQAEIGRHAA